MLRERRVEANVILMTCPKGLRAPPSPLHTHRAKVTTSATQADIRSQLQENRSSDHPTSNVSSLYHSKHAAHVHQLKTWDIHRMRALAAGTRSEFDSNRRSTEWTRHRSRIICFSEIKLAQGLENIVLDIYAFRQSTGWMILEAKEEESESLYPTSLARKERFDMTLGKRSFDAHAQGGTEQLDMHTFWIQRKGTHVSMKRVVNRC
jgi:hypothetical protein